MASHDSVIRLLFVEDRLDDAEQLISILRNGGIAVRPNRPESVDELARMLKEQPIDLVLASQSAKSIPFAQVLEVVEASGKDIPVLATVNAISDDIVLSTVLAGAHAVALRGKAEHLQHVVRDEFATLDQRRSVRRLEASLRETERRCDALIASSRDPIAYVHEGMHIRANNAYLEMFGYESYEEVEGLPLLDMIAGSDAGKFKDLLKKLSKGEAPPKNLELKAQRSDGEAFDAVMEFAQASYEGEPCLQIVFHQRTVDAEMVKELDVLRQRDQVTGLYNRTHFTGELDGAIALAAEGRGDQALLLIELDNYATVLNAIGLGHADQLLNGAARRIESALGDNTVAARFSDHGFAVLARESDHVASRDLAEKIRAGFQGTILEVGDSSITPTVSIGGVQIGQKIASAQQVLNKASQCLQDAITEGGNRVLLFDPAARDRAEEERIAQWVERIKAAIAGDDGFVLNYQPIISLHGDGGEVYQVLLRMKGPTGDVVKPATFYPIAAEHELLGEIDRWVIQYAIKTIAARGNAGKVTTLFVKLTPESLQDAALAAWVGTQLKQGGVPGSQLVLSVPEAKAFTNLKATQDLQKSLAKLGVSLCLEQFGLGLNSFQLLTHIDAGYLKIDQGLIGDLGKNPENQKKVREIADKAKGMNKRTIAEGVQDAGSMTTLFTSSVTFVEGNFLAPPGPEMNYDFNQ
jgi:diguanylate cyclase (GGDEF)-like protein/PAS domain S-box-containing protein